MVREEPLQKGIYTNKNNRQKMGTAITGLFANTPLRMLLDSLWPLLGHNVQMERLFDPIRKKVRRWSRDIIISIFQCFPSPTALSTQCLPQHAWQEPFCFVDGISPPPSSACKKDLQHKVSLHQFWANITMIVFKLRSLCLCITPPPDRPNSLENK